MYSLVHEETQERRETKPDAVMKAIKIFSGVNVGVMIASLILIALAQPVSFNQLDANLGLRTTWDVHALRYLFCCMIVGLFVGSYGLLMNSQRLKRRGDFIRFNLVFITIASALSIVTYLIAM